MTCPPLHDMHCHLDFMTNGEEVAAHAAQAKTLLFANTVTPQGWQSARDRFGDAGNVVVGFGMHPWWVEAPAPSTDAARRAKSQRAEHKRLRAQASLAEPDCERAQAQREAVIALLEAHRPTVIGEIGLDFGWQHAHSAPQQLKMLGAIAAWAADAGGRLISLHSVQAAGETLEALERSGAIESCDCVFHWFTGPSDLLKRAVTAGCYFSCGPRMLATKKGREYVKAIPEKQLLLETDAPPQQGMPYSFDELQAELELAAQAIASIKGEAALALMAETSRKLLERL